jgi:hypothetical protein
MGLPILATDLQRGHEFTTDVIAVRWTKGGVNPFANLDYDPGYQVVLPIADAKFGVLGNGFTQSDDPQTFYGKSPRNQSEMLWGKYQWTIRGIYLGKVYKQDIDIAHYSEDGFRYAECGQLGTRILGIASALGSRGGQILFYLPLEDNIVTLWSEV